MPRSNRNLSSEKLAIAHLLNPAMKFINVD